MSKITEAREKLVDSSAEIRRQGVLALASSKDAEGVPLLMKAMGDEDWRVRKEAARAASKRADDPEMLRALVEATNEEDNIGLKNAARDALSQGGPVVESAVSGRLSHPDSEARITAVDILGALRTENSVRLLSGALADGDLNVRVAAAERLGEQSSETAAAPLIACLTDANPLLRITALQSLRSLDVSVPWVHLAPLLDDAAARDALLPILGRAGTPEAVAETARHVGEESGAVKALERLHDHSKACADAVVGALSNIGEREKSFLIELTGSDEPDISRAAVRCLLWTRDAAHIPDVVTLARHSPIYPLLIDGLSEWGAPAVFALRRLLNEEAGHRLASVIGLLTRLLDDTAGAEMAGEFSRHLRSDHPAVITAAISATARFGDAAMLSAVLPLLSSTDGRIRGAAGAALLEVGRRRPEAVREAVLTCSMTGASGVQVCRVLEAVGTELEFDLLLKAADSEDRELRRAALRPLAAACGEKALPRIEAALLDEDMKVRLSAADALALMGEQARETVVRALKTAEGPPAAALIRALGKVGHPDAAEILAALCLRSADMVQCALEAATQLRVPLDEMKKQLLGHSDPEVVKAALTAFGGTVTIAELGELCRHERWDLRLRAVEELRGRGSEPGTREIVAERLEKETDDLVRAALKAPTPEEEKYVR